MLPGRIREPVGDFASRGIGDPAEQNAGDDEGARHAVASANARATATRVASLPGAPTIGESLPGYEASVWFGILAPAGTPAPVIAKLNAAIRDVLANPELQKKFVGYGCVATPSTPQEFAALIGAEVPKWKSVVETQKITTQ